MTPIPIADAAAAILAVCVIVLVSYLVSKEEATLRQLKVKIWIVGLVCLMAALACVSALFDSKANTALKTFWAVDFAVLALILFRSVLHLRSRIKKGS
jgi:hypothetical protein